MNLLQKAIGGVGPSLNWRKNGDSNPGDPVKSLHTFQACQFNHSCILPFLALFYTIPQRTLQACQYRSVSLRSSASSLSCK